MDDFSRITLHISPHVFALPCPPYTPLTPRGKKTSKTTQQITTENMNDFSRINLHVRFS